MPSLSVRILLGCAVFAILAIIDLRQNGRQARRWREYLFLIACVAVAMMYGVINDQLTGTISWEYFYYGKGLFELPGWNPPPAQLAQRIMWARIGMAAT